MSLKRLIVIVFSSFITLSFLIIFALYWIDRDHYLQLLTEKIRAVASPLGANIVITKPGLSGFSYYAESLSLSASKNPFYLSLSDLKVSPFLFGVAFSAKAYQGTIEASLSRQLSASISNLQLAEHPQLRGLGFEEGAVNGSITGLRCARNLCSAGTVMLKVENIQARQVFMIGELSNGLINGNAHFTPEGLTVDNLAAESSLFNARGEGLIPYSQLNNKAFEIKVVLSDSGQKRFGPFLQMVSGGKILPTAKHFSLRWNGTLQKGKLLLMPS